jgi:hypothetical protein
MLTAAPHQINTYVLINEETDKRVGLVNVNTSAEPRPADFAKQFFKKELSDPNVKLYLKVGGQD